VCACKHRHKAKNEWRRQSRWILEKNEWAIPIGIAHFVINSQSKRVIEKSGFRFVKENTQIARDGHEYISLYYVLDNPLKKN